MLTSIVITIAILFLLSSYKGALPKPRAIKELSHWEMELSVKLRILEFQLTVFLNMALNIDRTISNKTTWI